MFERLVASALQGCMGSGQAVGGTTALMQMIGSPLSNSGEMAEILPQMIDKLTPQGQSPHEGIEDASGMPSK